MHHAIAETHRRIRPSRGAMASPVVVLVAVLLAATRSGPASADNVIEKYRGRVFVVTAEGLSTPVAGRTEVAEGSRVETGEDGRAVLRTPRGTSVLAENSAVRIDSPSWFRQFFGRVYYAIRRLTDGRSDDRVRVQTQTATMGVRGTEFLVEVDDERERVAMADGSLSVRANRNGFNLYREQTLDEFQAFRREIEDGVERMREEFEAYRASQQRDFVGYVRSLELGAGQAVTLRGSEAVSAPVDPAQRAAMAELAGFAGALLDSAREAGGSP